MSGNSRTGSKGASLWIAGPGPRRPRLESEFLAWAHKHMHTHMQIHVSFSHVARSMTTLRFRVL